MPYTLTIGSPMNKRSIHGSDFKFKIILSSIRPNPGNSAHLIAFRSSPSNFILLLKSIPYKQADSNYIIADSLISIVLYISQS